MKPIHSFASALLLGTLAALAACAEGTALDAAATDFVQPKETKDPTEPADDRVTVPPKDSEDDEPDDGSSSSSGSSGTSSGSSGTSSGSSGTSSGSSGTSSGSSGTSSGSSGTSSSGGVDAGACTTVPPSNTCGLTPQCGCAANQTCDVTNKSDGSVSCILAGGGPLASLCTTTSQCAAGLTCAYGACRPYCAPANAACTGAGLGMCGQYYDPPGTAVPNSNVCTIECDLRIPSAACGSNTCIWDGSLKASDCDRAGTKGVFAKCTSYNDCQPGMACVNHPLFGFECEPWCRIGSGECGLFSSCVDVYGAQAPVQSGFKLGHCR